MIPTFFYHYSNPVHCFLVHFSPILFLSLENHLQMAKTSTLSFAFWKSCLIADHLLNVWWENKSWELTCCSFTVCMISVVLKQHCGEIEPYCLNSAKTTTDLEYKPWTSLGTKHWMLCCFCFILFQFWPLFLLAWESVTAHLWPYRKKLWNSSHQWKVST